MSDLNTFHKEPNYKSFEEFLKDFGKAMPRKMDLSLYNGNFQCACGKVHRFVPKMVFFEGFLLRVLVCCPDDARYLTNLKIKTGFLMMGFKGFQSVSSTYADMSIDDMLNRLTKKMLLQL